MKYYVHISMTHNYLIFNKPYIQLFISISQLSYPKYYELWNWNVLQNDTHSSMPLYFVIYPCSWNQSGLARRPFSSVSFNINPILGGS